jgi:AcrR family transcriptional regulator
VNANVTKAKPAARSQRKAKGDGHLRRAEILHAAEQIFVECGYEGATIRRIADEVGVSSTALYMHFRDKSEILVEICSEGFARLISANAELAAKDMDPVERVRQMLDAYVAFGFDNPNAYQLVFCPTTAEIPPDKQAVLNELGGKCYELFSGAVARIRDAGRLKTDDAHAAAQILWTAPHGLISLVIIRPTFPWTERETLVPLMLDSVFSGLVKA